LIGQALSFQLPEGRMKPITSTFVCALILALVASGPALAQGHEDSKAWWTELDPEFTLYVYVPDGRLVIALSQDLARNHVRRIKSLARERYYDGFPFVRVIPGFVSQASDPAEFENVQIEKKPYTSVSETIAGQFDEPFTVEMPFVAIREPDEFQEQQGFLNGFPVIKSLAENKIWITTCPLSVGMPRDLSPDSGTTGFWIAHKSNQYNDRVHTVFGRLIDGRDHAMLMPRASADDPSTWTVIDSVRVAADLPRSLQTPYRIMDTSSERFLEHLALMRNHPDTWFLGKPVRLDNCYGWIVETDDGSEDS
jgi:peptidylprolyl isomerase